MKITRQLLKEWKFDPLLYIEAMWGIVPQPLLCQEAHEHAAKCYAPFERGKHLTWQQAKILEAVKRGVRGEAPKRISVRAGHGIGKSAILAHLTHWFLMTRLDAQIGCTAPTADQLYEVLWKEIAIWNRKLDPRVASLFDYSTTHYRIKERANTWFARARTARKEAPEAMAGLHGNHVAIFGDEASGIPDEIYRAGEGSLTNKDILLLLISNPTRLEGYFYDTHHEDKAHWQTLQFSSIDSPIVEHDFAQRIEVKYGKDSDEFRFMVLGEFPKGGGMIEGWLPMFTKEDIENAETPDIGQFLNPCYLGIDPSGQGKNKTVGVVRDMNKAKVVFEDAKSTTLSISEKLITLAMHYKVKPENVIVDNFGVGANIAQEVALGVNERIRPVNVGHKSSDERFINIRAHAYWLLKEWLHKGGKLVKHEAWRQLLVIYYKRTMTGKIQIMGKEEMQKRGWDSPDCPDALSLSFVPRQEIQSQIDTPRARTHLTSEEVASITSVY